MHTCAYSASDTYNQWCRRRKNQILRADTYFILLFKSIAFCTLHLGDVLQQVSYTDGWMELSSLVGHIHWISLLIGMGLDQAACVTDHRVGFI